jgi:hypothetical protein
MHSCSWEGVAAAGLYLKWAGGSSRFPENSYCLGNMYIASVAAEILETCIKWWLAHAQCFLSYQLLSSITRQPKAMNVVATALCIAWYKVQTELVSGLYLAILLRVQKSCLQILTRKMLFCLAVSVILLSHIACVKIDITSSAHMLSVLLFVNNPTPSRCQMTVLQSPNSLLTWPHCRLL